MSSISRVKCLNKEFESMPIALLDRYKTDLKRLIEDGNNLTYGLYNELSEYLKKDLESLPKEKRDKIKKCHFKSGYNAWYNESLALIRQLVPDRLEDFKQYYKYEKRKVLSYETYSVSDYLIGVVKRDYMDNIVVGETDVYVARATGKSTYIVSIKVTGGEREAEIPAEPTAATTWNFAVTSEADSLALAALVETNTWTYTTEGSRFQYNVEVAANKFVDLGEIGFPGGAGIQVGRSGGKLTAGSAIRVDVNNRVQLNCSNGQFRIPDLAKNDVVKIRYASGSGTEARTFTVTNGTPATLDATVTSDAADVIEAEVTVTADGDLTLLQSKAINVYAIAINTELPEVPSDEPSDPTGINTVATDAAKANVVKKYVDGKQVVIEKNGKKYNVAGAQIK